MARLLVAASSEGVSLSPDQLIALQQAVLSRAQWEPADIKTVVRCIAAKSAVEWHALDTAFRSIDASMRASEERPSDKPLEATNSNLARGRRVATRKTTFIVTAVMAAIVVVAVRQRMHMGVPAEVIGGFAASGTTGDAAPPPASIPHAPKAPTSHRSWLVAPGALTALHHTGIGALGIAATLIALHFRRRAVGRRRPLGPPFFFELSPPSHFRLTDTWSNRDVERSVSDFATYARLGEKAEVDAERTIDQTIAAADYPTVVLRGRLLRVPWLVAIDTFEMDAGWHVLVEALLQRLAHAGLELRIYEFRGSPAKLRLRRGRTVLTIAQLAELKLPTLFFGTGDGAWDHESERVADWVHHLRAIDRCIWCNPSALDLGLSSLEQYVTVAPAGLRALSRFSERRARKADPHALAHLPVGTTPTTTREIGRYFGRTVLRWLAVCAIAGPPEAKVALWVLDVSKLVIADELKFQVLALSWFSVGRWPASLQAQLAKVFRESPREFVEYVRDAVQEQLDSLEPPLGSYAHLRWQLARAETMAMTGAPGVEGDLRDLIASPAFREARALKKREKITVPASDSAVAAAMMAIFGLVAAVLSIVLSTRLSAATPLPSAATTPSTPPSASIEPPPPAPVGNEAPTTGAPGHGGGSAAHKPEGSTKEVTGAAGHGPDKLAFTTSTGGATDTVTLPPNTVRTTTAVGFECLPGFKDDNHDMQDGCECEPSRQVSWFTDGDGDGFGAGKAVEDCVRPDDAYKAQGGDCDDTRRDVHPGAGFGREARDFNCDGKIEKRWPSLSTGCKFVVGKGCFGEAGWIGTVPDCGETGQLFTGECGKLADWEINLTDTVCTTPAAVPTWQMCR